MMSNDASARHASTRRRKKVCCARACARRLTAFWTAASASVAPAGARETRQTSNWRLLSGGDTHVYTNTFRQCTVCTRDRPQKNVTPLTASTADPRDIYRDVPKSRHTRARTKCVVKIKTKALSVPSTARLPLAGVKCPQERVGKDAH